MKKHFTEMSNDDYFVTKCCKSRDFLRSINDKTNVWCTKCRKVTSVKLVKFWEEEFEDEIDKRGFYKFWVETRLKRFIGEAKVKIKARKGKIVIERIK